MNVPHEILAQKLKLHSSLDRDDEAALASLNFRIRRLEAEEDIVRQGDEADAAVIVTDGLMARYHALDDGERQVLSFHFRGELPCTAFPLQGPLDHGVCAMGAAEIALVAREEWMEIVADRPNFGIAVWRQTLVDAAILRQTIVNNSHRSKRSRLAHLLCELYVRALAAGVAKRGSCQLPLSQRSLASALGMSLVTMNRTLQSLRRTGAMEFHTGELVIHNWAQLAAISGFDPGYLSINPLPRL
jgi:CRP-like cAMP-binding protein